MTSRASVSQVNLLIRGGYVLTMDSAGDIPGGDVHIKDGEILVIGTNLDAPGAEVVAAEGKLVVPGLIDTHWHMWNTLLRGMSDGCPGAAGRDRSGYFVTCVGLGRHFLPADTYAGTRLGCAEAIDAGITTVHDWAHNVRGVDYADADADADAGRRALRVSGLRARFSYGYETGHRNDRLMALDDLAALASQRTARAAQGRIRLRHGLAGGRRLQPGATGRAVYREGCWRGPASGCRGWWLNGGRAGHNGYAKSPPLAIFGTQGYGRRIT